MPSASPDSAAAQSPAEHNLPTPLTSLIGRDRELKGIARALRDARLITVTGPGPGRPPRAGGGPPGGRAAVAIPMGRPPPAVRRTLWRPRPRPHREGRRADAE